MPLYKYLHFFCRNSTTALTKSATGVASGATGSGSPTPAGAAARTAGGTPTRHREYEKYYIKIIYNNI